MHVNWFTIIAQVINFILLVWLLSHYLYKPILNAIEEREKKIKVQLEDARSKVSLAEKEQDEFRTKNLQFDREKNERLQNVINETERKRQELLDRAEKDADNLRLKLEIEQNESQKEASQMIANGVKEEVFSLSRKILKDISSVNLEEQSVDVLIDRIESLSSEKQIHLRETLNATASIISVRSAFDLNQNARARIERKLIEIVGASPEFKYETFPELICGVELIAGGIKLGWNFSSYFESLEKNISESWRENF